MISPDQPLTDNLVSAGVEDPDNGVAVVTWQWSRATSTAPIAPITWEIIPGATTATYTPVEADNKKTTARNESDDGYYLRAIATYTDITSDMDDPKTVLIDERTQKEDDQIADSPEAKVAATEADGTSAENLYRVMVTSKNAVRIDPKDPALVDAPEFADSSFDRMVVENAEVGSIVGPPVQVMPELNKDGEPETTFSYDLKATITGDDDYFDIDEDSGQIRVNEVAFDVDALPANVIADCDDLTDDADKPDCPAMDDPVLDYEGTNTFTIIVTAIDDNKKSRKTTATVNIALMNLNEGPYFDKESRQDVVTPRAYRESRTNAVIQLAAIEPDGHDLKWEVTGPDASDFEIASADDLGDGKDRRHLMFKNQPDYETPKGTDGNMYEVTVRATEVTAVAGGPKKATELDVMVQVEDVNEPGMVELDWLQPEIGTTIAATVTDPDTDGEVQSATGQTDVEYTWYRSKVGNPNKSPGTSVADLAGEWEEITSDPTQAGDAEQCAGDGNATNEMYTPQGDCAESDEDVPAIDDEGKYLLVRAVYRDDSAVTDDGSADLAATTTAIGISAYKVQADVSNDVNNSPDFRSSTASRTVPEDTAKGMLVGAPVDVDRNEDGDVLTYEIVMSNTGDDGNLSVVVRTDAINDAEFFSIDKATGQLMVGMSLTAEMEDKRPYSGDGAAIPGKYVVVVRATDPSGEPDDENRDDIVVTITATDVNEAPSVRGLAELAVNEANSTAKNAYFGLEYRLNPGNSSEYLQDDEDGSFATTTATASTTGGQSVQARGK